MGEKKILLTLAMITNGLRPELEKSLKSLDHIRKTLPCELIVTDTGCPAEARAVIEKYADEIIDFTWCNDFSAARNTGLFVAHGEWYMYLDDDEWFDDTTLIEEFFLKGTYKKFLLCNYVQRNYTDFENTAYNDATVTRLARIVPGIHFHGRIHEYLSAEAYKKADRVTIYDYVNHYGYLKDESLPGENREGRNVPLLKQQIEEEPDNDRWYYQLLQEYDIAGKYEEAEACARAALDRIDYRKMNMSFYHAFVLQFVRKYYREEDWQGGIDYINRLLERKDTLKEPGIFYQGMLFLYMAHFYINLPDAKTAMEWCGRYVEAGYHLLTKVDPEFAKHNRKKYKRIIKRLLDDEVTKAIDVLGINYICRHTRYAFTSSVINNICVIYVKGNLALNNEAEAAAWFDVVHFHESMMFLGDAGFMLTLARWIALRGGNGDEMGDRPRAEGEMGDRPRAEGKMGDKMGDRPQAGDKMGDRPQAEGEMGDRPQVKGKMGDSPYAKQVLAKIRSDEFLAPLYEKAEKIVDEEMQEQAASINAKTAAGIAEIEKLAASIRAQASSLLKMGDSPQAKALLTQLLSINPDDAEAKALLEEIGDRP